METKDTKEVQIVAPDGYEIDREHSTLERIVFKKKDDKPRSWEEFCKRGFTGKEGFVVPKGATQTSQAPRARRNTADVGYVDNVEEAKAFVALMQLRQLRKAWVDNWEPDWSTLERKVVINTCKDCICIFPYCNVSRPLSFPTEDMAQEFLECFKDLLEQAKILL